MKWTSCRPPDLSRIFLFSGCKTICLLCNYAMWIIIVCSRRSGGCWWPGAYLAPGHLQPSWWCMIVRLFKNAPTQLFPVPQQRNISIVTCACIWKHRYKISVFNEHVTIITDNSYVMAGVWPSTCRCLECINKTKSSWLATKNVESWTPFISNFMLIQPKLINQEFSPFNFWTPFVTK